MVFLDLLFLFFFPQLASKVVALFLAFLLSERWGIYASQNRGWYFFEFCYIANGLFVLYAAVPETMQPAWVYPTLVHLLNGPVLLAAVVLNDKFKGTRDQMTTFVLHVYAPLSLQLEKLTLGRAYDPELSYAGTVYLVWLALFFPLITWVHRTKPTALTAHTYYQKMVFGRTGVAVPSIALLAAESLYTWLALSAYAAVGEVDAIPLLVVAYLFLKDVTRQ